MSQFYITSSGLPPPPGSVVTLTPDQGGAVIPDGAGNINVFGQTSSISNDKGIRTFNGGVSELDVRLTNRVVVTTTTSDGAGQTQIVPLLIPINATSLTFTLTLTAYDTVNNQCIGGEQIGLARSLGGAAVVIGTNDTFDAYDPALSTNDWEVIASGANLSLSVTGIAGHTIIWKAVFNYIQSL